jgi:hypothetical protein
MLIDRADERATLVRASRAYARYCVSVTRHPSHASDLVSSIIQSTDTPLVHASKLMQGKRFMVLVVTHLAASEQFLQTIDHVVSMREGGEEKKSARSNARGYDKSWSQHPCDASDGDYSMTHIRSCTTRTRHTYEACPLDSLKLTSKVSRIPKSSLSHNQCRRPYPRRFP